MSLKLKQLSLDNYLQIIVVVLLVQIHMQKKLLN